MAIDITMPALSPTMETGTLAKWHVAVGDEVKPGDVIAEIETDKATMEVEAIDEGTITEILVKEGAEEVPVNAVIARLGGEGEDAGTLPPQQPEKAEKTEGAPAAKEPESESARPAETAPPPAPARAPAAKAATAPGERIIASPLARRIARQEGVDLAAIQGTGPYGRIVKADVEAAKAAPAPTISPDSSKRVAAGEPAATAAPPTDVPHEMVKLTSMRKTIARRLTESKQTIPHYYLTVDIQLDAMLKLRGELNKSLEARGVKLSVNDMLVKALGLALEQVPDANVSFTGDAMRKFHRADVSVAVAIPGGLITPVVRDAANKRLSVIATEMQDLAARAKEGKLQPAEYTGGTASLTNLGMYGISQFSAVINPPEGLIVAVGAGQKRPWIVDDAVSVATVLSATGAFDHRAIDGAVGAEFLAAFRSLIENPLTFLA
ncbi:MAG: pyruvate dehydrogenase complex dihydrolipoamide acetyltransferase [Sphingomonadaceae bacterium]